MTHTTQSQQKKIRLPVPMNGLINVLDNIKSKIDAAAGAATFLELHLRIIAQLDSSVQTELLKVQTLRKARREPYHRADLIDLIDAVIGVFQNKLDPKDQEILKSFHIPRNKTSHASFAELMIALSGEALGREIDPVTMKRKPLAEDDIIEGAICIERNGGLEEFAKQANKAVTLLREKVLRSFSP
jgi:hypothetical protein